MADPVPELELPRLPQWAPSHEEMQIWWQMVVEAAEAHAAAINVMITEIIDKQTQLNEQQETLTTAVEAIEDILVRLFDVEELADGTVAIVDQGLNADGTVKPNKVLTESVITSAISGPVVSVGPTVTIPNTGSEVLLHTTANEVVGDATYGSAIVTIQGTFDNSLAIDAAVEIYLDTNSNGAGWVRRGSIRAGARTSSGDTYAYIPFHQSFGIAGAGLTTLQSRMMGKAVTMTGGSLKQSDIMAPSMITAPGKR